MRTVFVSLVMLSLAGVARAEAAKADVSKLKAEAPKAEVAKPKAEAPKAEAPKPKAEAAKPGALTEEQKTLYALGATVGQSLSVFSLSKDELEMVKKGLTDEVTGVAAPFDVAAQRPKIEELARARNQNKAVGEKKKGEEYAAKAAQEKGAQKTASGLVYKELKAGSGASPKETDTVKVHYKGTLIGGKEFDSSYKRNQPAEFPLNGVIPCWTEGLQKMKVGGKAQLVCPSSIAYGDQGRPSIPGGATLIFEVELLDIVKK